MESENDVQTTEMVSNGRTPDGKFAKGSVHNPGGRPRNTLKDYLKNKFSNMTDAEKEAWLEQYKIPGDIMWKMAEGNPDNKSDVTSDGEKLQTGIIILPSKNDIESE